MQSQDPEDKTGTAILCQVSDAWPPIQARLTALSTEIQSTRVRSIVVVCQPRMRPPATIDVSTQRVFVSKLLELVAIMVKCAGGFIASRFKNDIFPLMSQMLGSFAEDLAASEGKNCFSLYNDAGFSKSAHPRQTSETSLIVSIVQCLASVFREPSCAEALAGLIPVAGALVLPFLGEKGELGIASVNALQSMLQVDADALLRPLVQLSAQSFPPPKPWLTSSNSEQERSGSEKDLFAPSLLQRRAKELVDFINGLPEQELF